MLTLLAPIRTRDEFAKLSPSPSRWEPTPCLLYSLIRFASTDDGEQVRAISCGVSVGNQYSIEPTLNSFAAQASSFAFDPPSQTDELSLVGRS